MSPKRRALALAFVSVSGFLASRTAGAQSAPPVTPVSATPAATTPPVAPPSASTQPSDPLRAPNVAPTPTTATSTTAVAPAPTAAPSPAASGVAPAVTAAPTAPAIRTVTSPGQAWIHVAVDHRDAWLEMRNYVDGGEFVRTCRTPCDALLQVEGREARVVAPGMTTSNIFRVAAGGGTAGVRVDGGSASARRAGIITLVIGIPLALAGMGLFAQGRVNDSTGLQAAGIAGLAAGGLSIGISLPLLLLGTTRVKDANGSLIASNEPFSPL